MEELRELFRKAKAMERVCLACSASSSGITGPDRAAEPDDVATERRVRNYLLEHLDEPLTIDQIARETGGASAQSSAISGAFRRDGVRISTGAAAGKGPRRARTHWRDHRTSGLHCRLRQLYSNFTTAFKKAYGIAPKYHRC